MRIVPIALMLALAVPAHARDKSAPAFKAMRAIEAIVPPQSWYPEGYYDVRIAAEAQMGEYPRAVKEMLHAWDESSLPSYDVTDCSAERLQPADVDPVTARYGDVALELSRLRSELERLKYPAAVYAEPLLVYEQARLVALAPGAMPESDVSESGNRAEWDASTAFVNAIEVNRQRLAPKLPKLIAGGCPRYDPSGGPRIIVKTVPPAGTVWLVNAFAFKVCLRQKPDPWDRMACKWNEIETGVESQLSGRYVYQVRWPDGTVRKGTREVVPDYRSETAVTVTFKKIGS